MRTSTIISVLLAGGALAKPVRKQLEERAIVVEHKVVTTVVWVTAGGPTPTAQPANVPVDDSKKAAVVQDYRPHRHAHGHSSDQASARKAAQQKVAEQKAAKQKAAEQKAAEKKAAEQKAAEQKAAEQKATQQKAADQKATEQEAAEPAQKAPEQKAEEPQTESQPQTQPQSTSTGGDTGSDSYKSACLDHHNIHRANHSANALEWDDTLAEYAKQTAQTCVWAHDRTPGGGGYGQNIAAGIPADQVAAILTNNFYNDEMMLYPGYGNDNPDMGNFEKWGHFSQMLWGSTKKVGCYTYTCGPGGSDPLACNPSTGQSYLKNTGCGNGGMAPVFTVCNYSPPGNPPDSAL
ncbi:MAG: hypothetical protein Q9166_004864 [cf. Caloplaca sp. 2 TL-2023]